MRLTAVYRGAVDPFEGDRELLLRALPADALVLEARATVTPVAPWGAEPFLELIAFNDGTGDWGATKIVDKDTHPWVDIDFHARRMLASVEGTGGDVAIQVDLGGTLIGVTAAGTFPPGAGSFPLKLTQGLSPRLPGLAVTRFRLTSTEQLNVDVKAVRVRSYPTNVTLRLGQLGPFWFNAGELSAPETSSDFAPVLEGYLTEAEVADGMFLLPFVVHSDLVARLEVQLEIDYLRQESLLPEGLSEVLLAFDHSTLAKGAGGTVGVDLPAGAEAVASHTGADVIGAFDSSRVVVGELGPVAASALAPVTPDRSQAQPIELSEETTVTAADLLLGAVGGSATISATLLPDSDGKPFGDPLLAAPVTVRIDQETPQPVWMSAALPGGFQLLPGVRYWLVVRALQGVAVWAADAAAEPETVGLQSSVDGGLAWRLATDPTIAGPLAARFRLRSAPAAFKMPIELRAGTHRVGLEKFEPLGRVDFALDGSDLAGIVNAAAAESGHACPETEHLANGDFESWYEPTDDVMLPEEWELTSGVVRRLDEGVTKIAIGSDETVVTSALSQVAPVHGGCTYVLECNGRAEGNDAVAELIWLAGDCSEARTDILSIPVVPRTKQWTDLNRLVAEAPSGVRQAEVRFLVPARSSLEITRVSLSATTQILTNPDLSEVATESFPGWSVEAEAASSDTDFHVDANRGEVELSNATGGVVTLTQRVSVPAGAAYVLELGAAVLAQKTEDDASLELRFVGAELPEEPDVSLRIARAGFDRSVAEGEVPSGVGEAELRLVLPDGAAILVDRIALRVVERLNVPVAVVAQAPGELTLSDGRVAYDIGEPAPPPVPAALCTPTTPGQRPGAHLDPCSYCPCCGEEHPFEAEGPALTRARRPAVLARCTECGTRLVHLGGRLLPGAPYASVGGAMRARSVRLRIGEERPSTEPIPVIEIYGIGPVRAQQLEALGIPSVQALAVAEVETIADRVVGVSPEVAAEFIEEARRMTASGRLGARPSLPRLSTATGRLSQPVTPPAQPSEHVHDEHHH